MPKQRTKKSISKRFKVTKSGKVFRGSQYSRHKRASKSKKQIRNYKEPHQLGTRAANVIKSLI